MSQATHILMLEDRPADAELAMRELRREEIPFTAKRVCTEADFLAELQNHAPDIILADNTLPGYDGLSALKLAQRERPAVPFLFVSGTLGEERAIDALHHGATDYVLKQRLGRLGPAVRRALREIQERTQRQQADESLRVSEERFRSVWDRSIDGMRLTDREGRILAVNEAFCRLVKLPPEKLVGEVFPAAYQGHGPDEGIEVYQRRFDAEAIESRIATRVRLCNSEELDVEISSSFVELGQQGKALLSIFRDITERQRAELLVAASSKMGQQLSAAKTVREAAEIIVEVADQLLGWDACNFALYSPAEKLIHHVLNRDTVSGRRIESEPAYNHAPPTPLTNRAIVEGGQLILKEDLGRMQPGGVPFGATSRPAASLLFVPVRNGTDVIGVLTIQSYTPKAYDQRSLDTLQNLADHCGGALNRITTEEMLRTAQQQLRQSQKMEAVGQLAGGVAHDFNNMLAVIRGNADLLLMDADQLSAAANEGLNHIIAASEKAANLTRQLLVFSRKQVMQSQPLALNDLIRNLAKMLRRTIREDIRLECLYADPLPFVQADPGMLEQVLLNLVVNARDAMPHGGDLRIATEKRSFGAAQAQANPEVRAGEFICLSVSDTGIGIAPEHLPRVFEPFFTTKEPDKGTGLGLATVYGIVKQHQGWIELSSKLGAGTCFNIFLPAIPAPAPAAGAGRAESTLRGGTERILLVEDEFAVRAITQQLLETNGYRVWEAASAQEALELWRAHASEVDLLLSDLVLPGALTGRELAERLRQEKPPLKVIFMSGYSPEAGGGKTDFVHRLNARFLPKPCATRTILEAVRSCLDAKESAAAPGEAGCPK